MLACRTNKQIVGEKMYLGTEKVSIFSKNTLTSRVLPVQSFTEHRTQNTEHRTQNTEHRTQHINGRIYRVNFLSHKARPQAEFPSAASLRLNHFFPVIIPAVRSGKNKIL